MTQATTQIPVWDTITAAWEKSKGAKATIWAAFGILFLISFGIAILGGIAEALLGKPGAGLFSFIGNALVAIMQFGLIYIGICRASDRAIDWRQIFYVFNWQLIWYLILFYLIQFLIYLPVTLLVIAGISLTFLMPALGWLAFVIAFITGAIISVRIIVSLPIILDQSMHPWRAIKLSFQLTSGNFWHLAGILFLQFVIMVISAIPFGIGLIWTIPFALVNYGLIYRRLTAQPVASQIAL